jgi:hypothetical protein
VGFDVAGRDRNDFLERGAGLGWAGQVREGRWEGERIEGNGKGNGILSIWNGERNWTGDPGKALSVEGNKNRTGCWIWTKCSKKTNSFICLDHGGGGLKGHLVYILVYQAIHSRVYISTK